MASQLETPWYERQLKWLLLAPAVLYLLGLSIYPLVYSVRVSLSVKSGGGSAWSIANFTRLFSDPFFATALFQTFVYTLAALVLEFVLGLGLALLMNAGLRGRKYFRVLLLLPMLLPPVVVAVIWRLIYNPNFGLLNATAKSWGLDTSQWMWIAGQKSALASVILVDIWQWTPFMFLLLLAGLQSIPQDPYEAATMDGAGPLQTFRHITLPLLKPAILVALLLRTMDLLRIFDQIFILTEGGPGFATETASLYIYRTAFRFFDFGYAAAMSFVVLVLTTIISQSYVRILKR